MQMFADAVSSTVGVHWHVFQHCYLCTFLWQRHQELYVTLEGYFKFGGYQAFFKSPGANVH